MEACRPVRGLVPRVLGLMVVASLPLGFSSAVGNAAEAAAVSKSAPQPPAAAQQSDAQAQKAWSEEMSRLPSPGIGCFTATYPKIGWHEVECGRPSPYRNEVGATVDYVAVQSYNYITAATGTFVESSSIAGSETGIPAPQEGMGVSAPNIFTLQMNTQSPANNNDVVSTFSPPLCGNVANCSAWQQFVFSQTQGPAPISSKGQVSADPTKWPNTTPALFAEYWVYNLGSQCSDLPPPPPSFMGTWSGDPTLCVLNGPPVYVAPLTTAQLPGIVMTATAGKLNNGNPTPDTVTLTTPATPTQPMQMYYYSQPDLFDLANNWTQTEFNVFGDGHSSEATFTSPTTLVVNISIADGSPMAPTCGANGGTTAETNSLTLSGTPTVIPSLPEPSIEFTETNSSPTTESCSHSIGDTHLETLDGLFYDFQAAGDFVLAQADPDFVVQTRQVSGAPSWPLADLNHAVATQMGKSRVAICVLPTRLFVDGKSYDLGDGKLLSLPGGVKVYRRGDTYAVMRGGGDIVSAQINSNSANTWINVTVGIGRSAKRNVRGLLANPSGNSGELATRSGTVFAAPVSFADLYHSYADSWRVQSKETLLSPCGDRDIEAGVASKPFYANDLDPRLAERAQAICKAAGVKEQPQLDACELDTTVLGGGEAATVFARTLPIRAVLRPGLPLERIEKKATIRRP
jgi:hypothetical protein